MNVHDLVKLRFGGLVEIRMERTTRIVHQIVELILPPTVQHLADICHESIKCLNVTGFEPQSRCFLFHRFDFADERVGLLLIRAIRKNNIDAPPSKIQRSVASEPAASASDDRHPILHSSNRFLCHRHSFLSFSSSLTLRRRRLRAPFRLEIRPSLEVPNNPRLLRLPFQLFRSYLAGGRAVDTNEVCEPTKVLGGLFRRFADNRHVQAAADHASDVLEGDALVANGVVASSCGTLLQHEPVETSSIEPVHGGPAVKTVTNVR